MRLFLETFAKGDGHFPEDGGVVITQKDRGNLSALQAMAVLSGQSSTLYERMGKHDFGVLYVAKTSKRAHKAALTVTPVQLDMVWCPQTEHGTWIARRNGRTFVTGNSRPEWARGAIGGTLFTFKTFSISYVELMTRLATSGKEGRRAAAVGLAMLILASGLQGIPGADDLDDIIDGLMQRLGYNWSSKQKKREAVAAMFGEDIGDFLMRGMSGLPGAPIDVAGRLGLGNLIPGTGLLTKKTDYGRDVAEIAGPFGSLVQQAGTAGAKLVEGEVGAAFKAIMPVAGQNIAQAVDMASMGMYRDRSGKKVIDTDATDAVFKAIGFQPRDVAKVQNSVREQQGLIALNKMRETEIADKWARGIFEGDRDLVAEARDELMTWNTDNAESPIRIQTQQIIKRVQAMRMGRADRLEKTAPREIRASVRRELEAAR
jgi:hypothetical protein